MRGARDAAGDGPGRRFRNSKVIASRHDICRLKVPVLLLTVAVVGVRSVEKSVVKGHSVAP